MRPIGRHPLLSVYSSASRPSTALPAESGLREIEGWCFPSVTSPPPQSPSAVRPEPRRDEQGGGLARPVLFPPKPPYPALQYSYRPSRKKEETRET
eukprot:scaffold172633_cov33-Tisochrysis_lutea.AAC.4